MVERALIDHLTNATGFDWYGPGQHKIGAKMPAGIVEQSGGVLAVDGRDFLPRVELALVAESRTNLWAMAAEVMAIFHGMNPGPVGALYCDETSMLFGFVADPDRGTAAYLVATATYTMTLRPQGEEPTP